MKKFLSVVGITTLIIIMAIIIYICLLPYSDYGRTYSSVKIFEIYEKQDFYNFYEPYSYFNEDIKKKTLREVNKVKIYHFGEKGNSDYYSMTFTGTRIFDDERLKDFEIKYMVSLNSSEADRNTLMTHAQLIDEDYMIYREGEEVYPGFIYLNNDQIISITIDSQDKNFYTNEELVDIALKITRDTIDLNKGK